MSDEIEKKEEKGLAIKTSSPFAVKKVGIAAKAAEAAKAFNPAERENRIIVLADDSGSMSGTPIENAKKAISEFLKTCNPINTAVGIYSFAKTWGLTCDFISLDVLKESLNATESTPLYSTLSKIITKENLTRAVVFSDGAPTDHDYRFPTENDLEEEEEEDSTASKAGPIIQSYIDKKIPIDTVYIGNGENDILKDIAEWTGGIYLHFKDSGTFGKAFKFLAPAYRGLLKDPNFRKEIGSSE